ncbi:MAG TPA: diguanylate cyclase [Geomonas sp.]|nr:diguanylate cyclase [Geomonas sp.]
MKAASNLYLADGPALGDSPEHPFVLIVDDDAHIRRTLADILRLKGYRPSVAASGEEGLAALQRTPANVAIIDLGLPDMPGIELLHRIRSAHPDIRIIILTGNATLETAIEATNKGAFCYLLKPYDIEQLLGNLNRALDEQREEFRLTRQAANLEVFFNLSGAINRMIKPSQLFPGILRTMLAMDCFALQKRGLVFLADDHTLHLVSHLGIPDHQLEACRKVSIGECLCGEAAASGQPIIFDGTAEASECRRCCHLGRQHVIIPLKVSELVVGVLVLFSKPGSSLRGQQQLVTALGNHIGIAINNAKIHAETMSKSLHDPLTGLANREFMQIELKKYFELGKRCGHKFSAIMADIDRFKRYNDSYGHVEGDRLLVKVAGILLRELRDSDHVFRYGGEEFLIILPRTQLPEACEAAERIRSTVEAEAGVTISLGVATFDSTMTEEEQLLTVVDAALYRAKKGGRNRVEIGGKG